MSNQHIDIRPGFGKERVIVQISKAINDVKLDLTGMTLITEAATGAYAITPVIAAMSGALRVYALAKTSSFGTCDDAIKQTRSLADFAGVTDKITFLNKLGRKQLSEADIITNTGHIRPINASMIRLLKPGSVVPLMYEAWEFRDSDVDLDACRKQGITVVGTNERHPRIDVFGYLGVLAVKQLTDAGISVYKSKLCLLCDNDFSRPILGTLRRCGARVRFARSLSIAMAAEKPDAIVVALRPNPEGGFGIEQAKMLSRMKTKPIIIQFFGNVDRMACSASGLAVWPPHSPQYGHMGILPCETGPESTIRLQVGGLKSAIEAKVKGMRAPLRYGERLI